MKRTQGQRLVALLTRRAYTGMQLQMLGISQCWWKRCAETLKHMPDHQLDSVKGRDGLLRYRVVAPTKWTA